MAVIGREAARAPLTSADINDGIVGAADLQSTLDLSSKTITLPTISSLTLSGNLSVDGGAIKLDGNYPVGTNNVALGDTALDSNVSGNENTAIGSQALTAATASELTAVGYGALGSNTSGARNVAIGRLAAFATTTGGSSVSVGTGAAYSNTSGSYNTALGDLALFANTTASNNTAVGYQAEYNNQTGTGNVALGYQAMFSGTDGSYNVAIGYQSMDALSTGADFNVGVGASSLGANTTGESNTAVGTDALRSNTTASNNTAVGFQAGYFNTTGTTNSMFGANAGVNNSTGSANTFVGTYAGQENTTGAGNTVVGRTALRYNTTSGSNVAIGNDCLENSTGQQNTFVGSSSGISMTTGSKNTVIGRFSGNQGGLNITTLDNNIVLSDGDGNPRGHYLGGDRWYFGNQTAVNYWPSVTSSSGQNAVSIDSTGGVVGITTNASSGLFINRNDADGKLVRFYSTGTEEGWIGVSGTTVSYNGGHLSRLSQLPGNNRDDSILKGTVLTNLDEMAEWIDPETGEPEENEQLNKMAVSSVEGDPNVAGVFVNWDDDDDMNVAMTGDMIIRIAQGTTVQRGDLLMSAGDGTAKPQGDDIVRSKTIAKVTSTHVSNTYADGSYCVPCVLMAC